MKKRIMFGVAFIVILFFLLLSVFLFLKNKQEKPIDTTKDYFQDAKIDIALCILLEEDASVSDIENIVSSIGQIETRPYKEKEVLYIVLKGPYTKNKLISMVEIIQRNWYVDKAFLDFFVLK